MCVLINHLLHACVYMFVTVCGSSWPFHRASLILIYGAKQIHVSRRRSRVEFPYYFHEVRVTMMIWKQRAKLVMATARRVLKHPVHGIVILRLGIHASRPNVSKLCSFIGSTNPSILISVV